MINKFWLKIKLKLKVGFNFGVGRSHGKITIFHRGGSSKKTIDIIDFFRRINSYGFIFKIVKTSLFTSFLGFIIYENGLSNYILLSDKVNINSIIYSGSSFIKRKFFLGDSLPLGDIGLFSLVNNIELNPFKGSIYARSAGLSAILSSKKDKKILLKLKSGWNLVVSNFCLCSLGLVSNSLHKFYNYKKAGIIRSLGFRPKVRGVAMNPIDHPHGGGEGKKSPPSSARSPWGWLTKGTPSKSKKYQIVYRKKLKLLRF